MTSQTKRTIAHALLAALLAGFITGCACCPKKCGGPIFLTQPESQIALNGSTVTLIVEARNRSPYQAEPAEYQWYFAYAPIPGATSKTLTINNVQPGNAGRYFVIASGRGTAKSCDADIDVNTPDPNPSPTGNGGTLTVGVSTFYNGNGGQTCFPNPPWNKYKPLIGYFLGPNYPTPLPTPNFPNSFNNATVTIDTCDAANGTALETGIVIAEDSNPNTDKVCVPPPSSTCPTAPLLTVNQRPIAAGKKYRATIFYKSPTTLTNLQVHWHYP